MDVDRLILADMELYLWKGGFLCSCFICFSIDKGAIHYCNLLKTKNNFFMATCGFEAVYEWLLLLRRAVSVQSVYRPFSRVLKIVHT